MANTELLPIGLSLGVKGAFFLGISAVLYQNSDPVVVITFFQLLFLQSVLICFTSSQSFFTAFRRSSDDLADLRIITAHVMISIFTVMVFWFFWTSTDFYKEQKFELVFITLGAVFTGLTSPLLGISMRERGAFQTYIPSILLAGPCFLLLFTPGIQTSLLCYVALMTYQFCIFAVLAYQNWRLLSGCVSRSRQIFTRPLYNEFIMLMGFGFLSTTSVGFVFLFREYWSTTVTETIAAAVFFVFRFSDTFLQLLVTAAASLKITDRIMEKYAYGFTIISFSFYLLIFLILYGVSFVAITPIYFAIITQCVLDLYRIPAAMAFIYQMRNPKTSFYAMFIFGSVIFGAFIILAPFPVNSIIQFHILILSMSFSSLFITLLSILRNRYSQQ